MPPSEIQTSSSCLCGECGVITAKSAWSFLAWSANDELLPVPDGREPDVMRCPACSYDHLDDESGCVWTGTQLEMEEEREQQLPDFAERWIDHWRERAENSTQAQQETGDPVGHNKTPGNHEQEMSEGDRLDKPAGELLGGPVCDCGHGAGRHGNLYVRGERIFDGRDTPCEDCSCIDFRSIPSEPAGASLDLAALRRENVARMRRWHAGSADWSLADWATAMCGEAGEAANIIKKIRRHQTGIGVGPQAYPGVRDPANPTELYNTPPIEDLLVALGRELADVQLYIDLLAYEAGIDLAAVTIEKFNRVSEAQGFPERLHLSRSTPTLASENTTCEARRDAGDPWEPDRKAALDG